MKIGTVTIEECTIVNFQKEAQDIRTLGIFLEDEDTTDKLREQGDYTHMVVSHYCFQSRTKYIDNSPDQTNILSIDLECGTLCIQGTYMQLDVSVERTPGSSPGFFVNYRLVAMEE